MRRRTFAAWTLAAAFATAALGGVETIGLKWDAVDGATRYRIYYGTLPFSEPVPEHGSPTINYRDTSGPVTEYTLDGLNANLNYWICVKAIADRPNGTMLVSVECSNFIDGWPKPRVESIQTSMVRPGTAPGSYAFDVHVTGANFRDQGQGYFVDGAGIRVLNYTRGQTAIDLTIEWDATAVPGPVDLWLVNNEGSGCTFTPEARYAGCVATKIEGAFTISVDVRPGRVLRLDWIVP